MIETHGMSYAHAMSYDHSMSYAHSMSYDNAMSYFIKFSEYFYTSSRLIFFLEVRKKYTTGAQRNKVIRDE